MERKIPQKQRRFQELSSDISIFVRPRARERNREKG
uniref:Uncharacterized protein n=1 Tax=Rhizophora mucronata TaxID=61149 RepID=A0A2P2LDP2_RHIMU